jgi:ATP-binding cassette subfamily B protein
MIIDGHQAAGGNAGRALKTWFRLVRSLSRLDRRCLGVASVAMVVGSLMTASVPLIVAAFVDGVYRGGRLVGVGESIRPMLLLIAAYFVISAMDVVRHQKVHTVTTGFESEARHRIYSNLLRWDIRRFRDGSDGAIYGRANRGVEGAVRLIKLGTADLLPSVLVAIFAVLLAVVKYGCIGVVMSVVVPTGFGMVAWQIHSQNGIRVTLKHAKERIDGSVVAWLTMIKVIRTSGTESYFDGRIEQDCDHLRRTELRHHIAMSLFDAGKALNEAVWLIVGLLVTISLRPATSPGDLAGIVLIYLAITRPLRELHRVLDESSEAALQAQDLLEDLDVPIDESFDAMPTLTRAGPMPPATGDAIRFEDVTFQYAGSKSPTLCGLNTRIGTGERVGVVGSSGGGKSTLLDVLAGLHHGHTGQVVLHGRPIQTIRRSELVEMVGYVGQEPTLFPGTVRENLMLGRADITQDDLEDACRRAYILADIEDLPDGFETKVAQRGGNLSGGQRQRLCIARALLKAPRIMLLDEPTSALDGPSQAVVQKAIDELRDVTMLVVAHRLSTLKTMDRILVLHEGCVVEDGIYTQLAAGGGYFASLLESERWTAA